MVRIHVSGCNSTPPTTSGRRSELYGEKYSWHFGMLSESPHSCSELCSLVSFSSMFLAVFAQSTPSSIEPTSSSGIVSKRKGPHHSLLFEASAITHCIMAMKKMGDSKAPCLIPFRSGMPDVPHGDCICERVSAMRLRQRRIISVQPIVDSSFSTSFNFKVHNRSLPFLFLHHPSNDRINQVRRLSSL